MTVAVVLAVLAPLAVRVLAVTPGGRFLADALPPRLVAGLLTGLATLLAGVSVSALVLVALLGVVRWDPVAVRPFWSVARLVAGPPGDAVAVARVAAAVAGLVLLVAAARLLRCLLGIAGEYRTARAAVPRRATAGSVIEVPGALVAARAVAARRGHVLVDAACWRALSPAHREAVLAHERAHLRHRHDLYLAAAQVAQALHPLLAPVTGALGYALERWADEDAAAARSRGAVARAIGAVALSRTGRTGRPAPALGATGGVVPRRVAALLDPAEVAPGRARLRSGVVAVALASVTVAALGVGWHALVDFLEIAATAR